MASLLPIEIWERIFGYLSLDALEDIRGVSQLHRSIATSVSFQARLCLRCHSRCEAIYEVSKRKDIFTVDLLHVSCPSLATLSSFLSHLHHLLMPYSQTLLDQGAIMCRGLVQRYTSDLFRTFTNQNKDSKNNIVWRSEWALDMYYAVYKVGFRLYGRSIEDHQDDVGIMEKWIEGDYASPDLSDNIKEIFKKGKFAPYHKNSFLQIRMNLVVSKHPSLYTILQENGYEFTEKDSSHM